MRVSPQEYFEESKGNYINYNSILMTALIGAFVVAIFAIVYSKK